MGQEQAQMYPSKDSSSKRRAGSKPFRSSKTSKATDQVDSQPRTNVSNPGRKKRARKCIRVPKDSNNEETNLLRHLTSLSAWPTAKPKRRPKKPKPCSRRQPHRKSPLLSLPSEIRNLIYSFVVLPARIFVCGNHPNRERRELQDLWENEGQYVKKPRQRLSHLLDNDDIDDGLIVSSSPLLVCRTIREELELYMYSRLTFCFGSMSVVHRFLNVASKQGIKHIKNVELHHVGYGQPALSGDAIWKDLYDRKWQATCARLANELSLKSLKLQMSLHDWPVTLSERDTWYQTAMSLLANENGRIDHVEVGLQHSRFGQPKMAEVSRKLEDQMMNEKGKRARDAREEKENIAMVEKAEAEHRAWLAQLPPVQAKRVLSIVRVLPPQAQEEHKQEAPKEAKKYYSTRTQGFAKDFDALPREWVYY